MSEIGGWLESLAERFAAVDVRLALVALGFHLCNHLLRSYAWRNVLRAAYPESPVSLMTVGSSYAVGVALNAVVPARGGDAAKIGLLRARIHGSSVATIAGSMSVLMLFDSLAGTAIVVAIALAGIVPLSLDGMSAGGAFAWLSDHLLLTVAAAIAGGVLGRLVFLRARGRLRALWARVSQGGAILRTPGRYARQVVVPQSAAWACRIAVIVCLLAAFGLPATIPMAALVMVLAGASTLVPLTPGGAVTQQVVLAYALSSAASATAIVSFSIGMQVAITLVNALLGVTAAMVICRTLRPIAAIRSGLRLARAPQPEPA